MNNTAIEVEDLSKCYILKHENEEKYVALRDIIAGSAKRLARGISSGFSKKGAPPSRTSDEFWALKNVNFEIKQGERVGIIGRNGAGKSTLLKTLSRITDPTRGKITINGRVASLLEVGTGFHAELTGRENIYLNGAILGMGRGEIRKKFDEIVQFAEVEKFLDTPVKRYSSGMYVRLAFSVAAHLEPEILIVDEVLAVGDATFQKKCMGRMEEVGKEGRTVIFVSHNMGSIAQLCNKCIFLEKGMVGYDGDVPHAIQHYLDTGKEHRTSAFPVREDLGAYVTNVEVIDENNVSKGIFDIAENVVIRVHYKVNKFIQNYMTVVLLYRNGSPIFNSYSTDFDDSLSEHREGEYVAECVIDKMFLKQGSYHVDLFTTTHEIDFQKFPSAVTFDVEAISLDATSKGFRANRLGEVVMQGGWRLKKC